MLPIQATAPPHAHPCHGTDLCAARLGPRRPYVCDYVPGSGCCDPRTDTACEARIVTPTYYVELRAMDIESNEIESARMEHKRNQFLDVVRRLWPFRWPTYDPAPVIDEPAPEAASPEKGRYIDVVI